MIKFTEALEAIEEAEFLAQLSGKPKYMFRPTKTQGAQGFKQVKEWAARNAGR